MEYCSIVCSFYYFVSYASFPLEKKDKGGFEFLKEIIIIRNGLLICICILIFLLLNHAQKKERKGNGRINLMLLNIGGKLNRNKNGYFSYERIMEFLTRNGVDFIYQKKVSPIKFIVFKFLMGFLASLMCLQVSATPVFIPVGILVFFIPDIIIIYSNKSDNEHMLPDIKKIYDVIKVQALAGVYLTESLSECYLIVKNERLKDALLQMNNEIIAKKTMEEAVFNFNIQFHNSYIDTFCMIIKQSLVSGKKIQILEDISSNINNVQSAIYYLDKEKIDRRIQILELMIYIALMVICVFGISADVMSAILNF